MIASGTDVDQEEEKGEGGDETSEETKATKIPGIKLKCPLG